MILSVGEMMIMMVTLTRFVLTVVYPVYMGAHVINMNGEFNEEMQPSNVCERNTQL